MTCFWRLLSLHKFTRCFQFYFLTRFFYKQPSCYGSNVKNDLKVKQLARQPPTLKTFNLGKINLLSNPNVNLKNGAAYKKNKRVILSDFFLSFGCRHLHSCFLQFIRRADLFLYFKITYSSRFFVILLWLLSA